MKRQANHWLLALILTLATTGASAQVNRCKDASGKLIFSDRPCDIGQAGGQILRKPSDAAIRREREQAQEAEARKQDQRAAEQEREWAAQNQRPVQPQVAPAARHSGNDWASRKALENAATSAGSITNDRGRWDANAQAERAAKHREEMRKRGPEPQPEPEEFRVKGCNANGCIDTRGGTYTGGAIMRRNDGRQCSRSGNTIVCD